MRRQVAALLGRVAFGSNQFSGVAPCLTRSFADDANLKKTALYDFHVAHGGTLLDPLLCVRAITSAAATDAVPIYLLYRQDGALRWLVHAHPVRGLHHGLHHKLPCERLAL